jgi:hypothetical protein
MRPPRKTCDFNIDILVVSAVVLLACVILHLASVLGSPALLRRSTLPLASTVSGGMANTELAKKFLLCLGLKRPRRDDKT